MKKKIVYFLLLYQQLVLGNDCTLLSHPGSVEKLIDNNPDLYDRLIQSCPNVANGARILTQSGTTANTKSSIFSSLPNAAASKNQSSTEKTQQISEPTAKGCPFIFEKSGELYHREYISKICYAGQYIECDRSGEGLWSWKKMEKTPTCITNGRYEHETKNLVIREKNASAINKTKVFEE